MIENYLETLVASFIALAIVPLSVVILIGSITVFWAIKKGSSKK